jgi:outer membrane receptor protein involved in Fe transport
MRRPISGSLISSILPLPFFFSAVVCPLGAATDDVSTTNEQVVVTATRLDDKPVPKSDVPASVTILDRERIAASGARNLQDLLALEAGVSLIDQVGNDVQKTLDLRGFSGGKGVAVFVDGARLNDPRNNSVALEQIPLEGVERVEITRGPAAALAGGGAEAGVVRVVTRRGTTPGASLSVSAGTWNTAHIDGTYGGDYGRFDLFVAGAYDTTDGFRLNADGDQTRFDGALGMELGEDRRLTLSLLSSDLEYGNPGALTLAEFESDPRQNVFNTLDATDATTRHAVLSFQGSVGGGFSLAGNLAYHTEAATTLSTGRAAPTFGGFFLDADGGTWSGAAQATRDVRSSLGSHLIAFGAELLDGETESTGFFTDPASPGSYDPSTPASLNTAGARNAALFLQDAWTISSRWIVTVGARGDRSDVRYDETIPGTTPSDERTFSEWSFRAGATFRPSEKVDVYGSYGDGFLPPTAEQLFAFPLFGSNPDLVPEDTRAYEIGARTHGSLGGLEVALFWTDTNNEIVFDPTPTTDDPFGQNVNAGATRRRGVEVSARGRIGRNVAAFANATYTDAAFTNGANDGNRVPLVPELRGAAGFDASLPAGFGIRADALYVGAQVLDNDPANARAELADYTVVNLRVGWERGLGSRTGSSSASRGGRLGLFVEARNLFDEPYATRGIFAFDFSTSTFEDFVTPAPGRRYLAGLTWRM